MSAKRACLPLVRGFELVRVERSIFEFKLDGDAGYACWPPSKSSPLPVIFLVVSDLRCAAIDKQFDAGNEAAVIGCEEQGSFRNFVRPAYPPQRYGRGEARLELLGLLLILYQAIEARCVDRTRTDRIDTDLAVLEIGGPAPGERPHRGLRVQ